VRFPSSLLAELHEQLTALAAVAEVNAQIAAAFAVYETRRSRCGRYEIEVLPISGGWRVTNRITGRSASGESFVEIPSRLR